MTNDSTGIPLQRILRHGDLLIAGAVLLTLLVMILPIPPLLMDVLLATGLGASIAILLVAVYAARPLDFSIFPTVLLFATLFRLSLNVASTRLVLLHGHEGTAAAGHIIEAFGTFVVGGSYIVGVVVFILLCIINFVVITKGSGRVAEVAARFVLDAMPGKQMSIDADLNAGLITDDQARERRLRVEREADFYGAMDGASKFVRGDAIAGILITAINIVGGFAIGVLQRGLPLGQAAELYTLMTIGDGLVTQIPSLVVSTAAGIIVTRAASGSQLSQEVTRQIFLQPRAIGLTAVILFFIGVMPGFPGAPFFFLAAITAGLAWSVRRAERKKSQEERQQSQAVRENTRAESGMPPPIDTLELQVGYGLLGLVDDKSELTDRICQLRQEFAKDLGIVVPQVRIQDNLELASTQYAILIKGVAVGGGELMNGHQLAMDPGTAQTTVPGIETKEPVFGLPALWITEKSREAAQLAGYTVVDAPTILATHLSEVIRKHAPELIGRQELQGLIDHLSKTHPKVVEELIPKVLSLGTVLKVCQGLLREQVPIRDLSTILETLANQGPQNPDSDLLIEYCRAALARTITHRLTLGTGALEVITLPPRTEETLLRAYQKTEAGATLRLEPGVFERLVTQLQKAMETTAFSSGIPVLLCHPQIRGQFRRLVERFLPNLQVVSINEIAAFAKVKSLATVEG